MEDDEWKDDLQGTPQGAVVSPILANVYLHYVLDLWFTRRSGAPDRRTVATLSSYVTPMTSSFGLPRKADAEQFLHDLRERMSQFALAAARPDKTRLVRVRTVRDAPVDTPGATGWNVDRRTLRLSVGIHALLQDTKSLRETARAAGSTKPIAKLGHANLDAGVQVRNGWAP